MVTKTNEVLDNDNLSHWFTKISEVICVGDSLKVTQYALHLILFTPGCIICRKTSFPLAYCLPSMLLIINQSVILIWKPFGCKTSKMGQLRSLYHKYRNKLQCQQGQGDILDVIPAYLCWYCVLFDEGRVRSWLTRWRPSYPFCTWKKVTDNLKEK